MSEDSEKFPDPQGNGGGYGNPPAHSRFKPGVSGNPAVRKKAGAMVMDWINVLAEREPSEQELRQISRDVRESINKRAAANRLIRLVECPDIADFADLLNGGKSLEELRSAGVNTDAIRKFKQKTRRVRAGEGKTEEVIEREIELYDRAGDDFDRIMDRTEGSPKQHMEIDAPNALPGILKLSRIITEEAHAIDDGASRSQAEGTQT